MDDATPERWLPVPGYEGFYEVSDWGRVKSLPRPRCRLRILKNSPMPSGYLQVSLSARGVRHVCYVHRLVLLAFVGPCPDGLETRHGDGDRSNNRLGNLSYGTHEENEGDKIRHGTNRSSQARFTDTEVTAIREAWQQGARGTDLAIQYGSSKAAISRLVNGRTYQQEQAAA